MKSRVPLWATIFPPAGGGDHGGGFIVVTLFYHGTWFPWSILMSSY
jgi:hypothetical protein